MAPNLLLTTLRNQKHTYKAIQLLYQKENLPQIVCTIGYRPAYCITETLRNNYFEAEFLTIDLSDLEIKEDYYELKYMSCRHYIKRL